MLYSLNKEIHIEVLGGSLWKSWSWIKISTLYQEYISVRIELEKLDMWKIFTFSLNLHNKFFVCTKNLYGFLVFGIWYYNICFLDDNFLINFLKQIGKQKKIKTAIGDIYMSQGVKYRILNPNSVQVGSCTILDGVMLWRMKTSIK